MDKPSFYITTPIYYANSDPHIGSAYTTIIGDVLARYKRFMGYDVYYLTGTDEHGQKMLETAKSMGMDVRLFCDQLSEKFKTLWKALDITHDGFIRTTEPRHERVVQYFVQRMLEKGDVYKGTYEGWYCVPCETFCPEDEIEIRDGKKSCPSCGREVRWLGEENYFFALSKYQHPLLDHFRANPGFVEPDFRANEMIRVLESGLKDLSITRTTFQWGVPMLEDPKHVIYVWVDALINYISELEYGPQPGPLFHRFWPADVHLIGKEINRFHSIIWPAMLMSVGLPLPKKIFAHGWLTVNGEKISKSVGNAVDPRELIPVYGKDALKYYLLREIQFGRDGDFSEENLILRINADLANDLGNLVHRTLAMLHQNFGGTIPAYDERLPLSEEDQQLRAAFDRLAEDFPQKMDRYQFTQALDVLWGCVGLSNKYIDLSRPWVLAKDPKDRGLLGNVLIHLAQAIRNVALYLKPVMPDTSREIFRRLGVSEDRWASATFHDIGWDGSMEGWEVREAEPLFPRIDVKKAKRVIHMQGMEKTETQEEAAPDIPDGLIEIQDFAKAQLHVGSIVEAQAVPKSRKLVRLQVDLGSELGKRQIVAGIMQHYTPDQLLGKQVIVVTNLKPASLMGVESHGMLLAAKSKDQLRLLTVEQAIAPGATIS